MQAVIISCSTLREYVNAAQEKAGTRYPVMEMDRLYHRDPVEMREHVLAVIEALPKEYDTILVAMGFCGGSWENIRSDRRIVMARVDDCVTMLLTTDDNYRGNRKEAGHMYLLGKGENTFSVRSIREDLYRKYPEKRAKRVFDAWFRAYHWLDIVETGFYDAREPGYVADARADAESIEAELRYVPGSNRILEKLVCGEWDEQFLVNEPDTVITQQKVFPL